jgi:hypothetical protein
MALSIGTPASSREALPRRFENYIFTRVVDSSVGLTAISDSQFTQLSGSADYTGFNIGQGFCDDGYSSNGTSGSISSTPQYAYGNSIGFDFSFDGITYQKYVANANGWMVLVDPTTGVFSPLEVLISASLGGQSGLWSPPAWKNPTIKPTFSSNAVLLAPWFDDLRNVNNLPTSLTNSPYGYSGTKVSRIEAGLEPAPIFLNQVSYGVSHFHDVRSPKGKRLIVRWSSVSNYTNPESVIKFEVVIYENGTIEYRYTPRNTISQPPSGAAYEGATIGIFMPNGTNRFRDFAVGLGYREGSRQEYIYGGFTYTPSYVDATIVGNEDYPLSASYTINLTPFNNWPGQLTDGCVMSFSPPVNRRKVLPRLEIRGQASELTLPLVARTGDDRTGVALSLFDDRRSPQFNTESLLTSGTVPIIVNYPSTMQRFFGGTSVGTLERQDLFSNDMLVTGSISKPAIDPFLNEGPQLLMPAFNESFRPEQDQATLNEEFFMTGTNNSQVDGGFTDPLKSKTQIRFNLPVNTSVQMPGDTSSIYYYNWASKCWEVPVNSTYQVSNSGTEPPGAPQAGGDWANPQMYATNGRIIEDARGFGPIGNPIASGSISTSGAQTSPLIGTSYVGSVLTKVLSGQYPKSVRNNQEYEPVPGETFTLPINAPFLIEKMVIEIPMAAGPGWFNDQTQCFIPEAPVNGFDFAGPAMTVALSRNIKLSENNQQVLSSGRVVYDLPGPSMRDLILTGTITHQFDNTGSISSSFVPGANGFPTFIMRQVGFLSYANPPGAVVDPNASLSFTGSVQVQCEALSAVGPIVAFESLFASNNAAEDVTNVTNFLTLNPTISLSRAVGPAGVELFSYIAYVSPFGRGGTGFDPSGRSTLGNEFVTMQSNYDQTGESVINPFYLGPNGITTALSTSFSQFHNGGNAFNCFIYTAFPLASHWSSPYLVMPGDELVLSISKMRPYCLTTTASVEVGLPHDVQLMPGNVNITLYGSQIQEGVEYHDTLNQPLASNALHELIGADPVLDQFEVAYRNEYSGSFTDNVMLGSLLTQTTVGGTQIFVQGVRDRKLSVLNAANVQPLTNNYGDSAINFSKAYRDEPWWQMVGNVRTSQFMDITERFWDSLMPAIDQCFTADGCGIFKVNYNGFFPFGNPQQILDASSNVLTTKTNMGWLWFDYLTPALVTAGFGSAINSNWTKAYPFEPRYSAASRLLNISNGLIASNLYTQEGSTVVKPGSGDTFSVLTPSEPITSFLFGTVQLGTALEHINGAPPTNLTFPGQIMSTWVADTDIRALKLFPNTNIRGSVITASYYTSGSANADDISRVLFGFGDNNTYFTSSVAAGGDNSGALLGTGHFAQFRDIEGPNNVRPEGSYEIQDNNIYCFSPLIRGWKYGVYSGIPTFSKSYWRRGKFGQFRDMMEQRPYTKYYESPENGPVDPNFQQGVKQAVVTVEFISSDGRLTDPNNTWSSNLDFECTSSFPYIDEIATNRPTVNVLALNKHILSFRQDVFGNLAL